MLERIGYPIEGLHSKGWEAFSEPDSPVMDFVFTVCDNAAGEVCPVWPGQPMTAHWGIEDPAAVEGDRQPQAFWNAYNQLQRRIQLFLSLPLEDIDELSLSNRLKEIGETADQGSTVA